MERYETAFYTPLLSDWRNFESWRDGGSLDATQRANKIWKQLLAEYQEPKLEASVEEELSFFVEKRISEGGVSSL
jgi:trimethylamine--corrinoid protein Co-methyltransferase